MHGLFLLIAPLLVRGTPGSDPIRSDGEDRQVVLADDLGVAGVPCAGAPPPHAPSP